MYDRKGLCIGFAKISCPSQVQVDLKKSAKKVKPVKSAKTAVPSQPDFQLSKSAINLLDFLQNRC